MFFAPSADRMIPGAFAISQFASRVARPSSAGLTSEGSECPSWRASPIHERLSLAVADEAVSGGSNGKHQHCNESDQRKRNQHA